MTQDAVSVSDMIQSAVMNPAWVTHMARRFEVSEDEIQMMAKVFEEQALTLSDPLADGTLWEDLAWTQGVFPKEREEEMLKAFSNLLYTPRKKNKPYRGWNRLTGRVDGRRIKTLNPFMKIFPFIMTKRNDALNISSVGFDMKEIDAYLLEKKQTEGVHMTYLHFFIAMMVRVIGQRPGLNRFIMGNRHYARSSILVSMSVMKTLRDGGEETTVKFDFNGHESIYDVYHQVETNIAETLAEPESAMVEKILGMTMRWPSPILWLVAGTIKMMDGFNLIPKNLIKGSPFHTSVFMTYLKSVKLPKINHHIYNFGSTSLFLAVGKEEKKPVVIGDQVEIRTICELGVTMDERICEGLYVAYSMRLIRKIVRNPYLLDERVKHVVEDLD